MLQLPSNEGFLLSFRKPNLGQLQADAYSVVLQHHAKGHIKIKAEFRICFWRKKYLMISQIPIYATEKDTNKLTKLYAGTNAIKKFLIAKWKFDHAQQRGPDFIWNVARFDCDGSSVNLDTEFSEEILKRAIHDVNSGIVDRAVKSFFSAVRSVTLGKYRSEK